jgi:ankyrin repeat protein
VPAAFGKTELVIEIKKLLPSHGADPRMGNKNGKTPLDYVKNEEMKDEFRKHDVT